MTAGANTRFDNFRPATRELERVEEEGRFKESLEQVVEHKPMEEPKC